MRTQPDPSSASHAPLNRERIVRAAVALADEAGLEALSMRKLADRLGAGTMSLYNHVENKDDLLDGMIDVVFSEIDLPAADADWRTTMRERAASVRESLACHPWATGLM